MPMQPLITMDSRKLLVPRSPIIKYAAIAATSDGDNTAVAAVSDRVLCITSLLLSTTGAGLVALKSGASVTVGTVRFGADGENFYLPPSVDVPHFVVGEGLAFIVNNAAGVDTYGLVSYFEQDID